jgi:hypothetical protein
MKRSLFLVFAPAAGLVAGATVPQQAPRSVHWRTDWESARLEAQQNKKLLFVVFRCER